MSLENILKKTGKIILCSALFLSLGTLSCHPQKAVQPSHQTNFCYTEMKKRVEQESLHYNLKIYVIGFELINKTMTWNEKITEDSQKTEHELNVALRASSKYWGMMNMRKIDYKTENLEELCEEYSYSISDGKKIEGGHVRLYPNKAKIQQGDMLITKKGEYKGILSFLQDIREGDMKFGETRAMDVLFGKDVYHFEYKVVGEEILLEKYKTYKIDMKIRKKGSNEVREGIFFWVGKEGKHKNDIIQIEIEYNWAIKAGMVLKD